MSDTDTETTTTAASFTQEQVTAAATKAAKEAERRARQNAQQELADALGVPVDQAKAIIAAHNAAEEANATELDKARKAQAEAEARAAQLEAAAAQATATTNATTALVAAGVQPGVIADAIRLIDTAADDLSAEVEALKGRLPALFTTAATPPPPAPGITPPVQPAGQAGGKSAKELAQAALASRLPRPAA